VERALSDLVGLPALRRRLADEFVAAFKLENAERYINAQFKKDDTLSWRNALDNVLRDIQDAKHAGALKDAVRKAALETLSANDDE
jgi:hypothetical protein